MKKREICVVSSSRADYNHLYLLMRELKKNKGFNLKILVTGMHLMKKYGNTYEEIINDGFDISYKVKTHQKNTTKFDISYAIGSQFIDASKVLKKLKSDIIVVLGDRYDIYPIVVCSHIMGIPVAHLHGGEVTSGAIDDGIRHSITKLSDIHFAVDSESRKRIIQLGEDPQKTFNVGSLGVESISNMKYKTKKYIYEKYNIRKNKDYFVISIHPETICDLNKELVKNTIDALDMYKEYDLIFTSPNSDTHSNIILRKINSYIENNKQRAIFITSLGRFDYLHLMKYSSGVIGNSSSGIIEAPALNIPSVNIGNRQNGRPQSKSVFQSNLLYKSITKAIASMKSYKAKQTKCKPKYRGKHTVEKIVQILKDTDLTSIKFKKFRDIK